MPQKKGLKKSIFSYSSAQIGASFSHFSAQLIAELKIVSLLHSNIVNNIYIKFNQKIKKFNN